VRVLLDTNVLIAAFLTRGTCSELLEHCALHHDLISSRPILEEFHRSLVEKLKFPLGLAIEASKLVASRMEAVRPAPLGKPVCRDPDDDLVLATVLSGKCHCLVTGDRDLLSLGAFQGIPILSPSEFWRFEQESSRGSRPLASSAASPRKGRPSRKGRRARKGRRSRGRRRP
jgi:putative PIN family toxin of toxin-antitoxin system